MNLPHFPYLKWINKYLQGRIRPLTYGGDNLAKRSEVLNRLSPITKLRVESLGTRFAKVSSVTSESTLSTLTLAGNSTFEGTRIALSTDFTDIVAYTKLWITCISDFQLTNHETKCNIVNWITSCWTVLRYHTVFEFWPFRFSFLKYGIL